MIVNSILWANSAPEGAQLSIRWDSVVTIAYSDVQDGRDAVAITQNAILDWGEGMSDADPRFAATDDFRLLPESPCIDTGTNEPPVALPLLGFDGTVRPTDGDDDGVAIADIGAHEFSLEIPPLTPTLLLITGPRVVPEGRTARFTAEAWFRDGSHRDVTSDVDWSLDPGSFATIEAPGLISTPLVTHEGRVETVVASLSVGLVTETAEQELTIFNTGHIDIIAPSSLPENVGVPLEATFVPRDGRSPRNITAEAVWSISPDDVARLDAGNFLVAKTVEEDRVAIVTCQFDDDGVIQIAELPITIRNTALEGPAVLIDEGFSTVKTGGVALGRDGSLAVLYAFSSGRSVSRVHAVNVARQVDRVWRVEQVTMIRGGDGLFDMTQVLLIDLAGPVFDADRPGFVLGTATREGQNGPWDVVLEYFRFDGQEWQRETIASGIGGVRSLRLDGQGRPVVLAASGIISADSGQYGVRRFRRDAGVWVETNLDFESPPDSRWNFGMDRDGEVWYVRTDDRRDKNAATYRGSLTNANVPEVPHNDATGVPLPYGGRLEFDHTNRLYQVVADTGGPVSVIRPKDEGHIYEVVDDFGWGHSGSEKIVFDAENRPVIIYGMSPFRIEGSTATALWDELRAAALVDGEWIVRRIAGGREVGASPILSCQPAFDAQGNLHTAFIVTAEPRGLYYSVLPAGDRLLTGGEFDDPGVLADQFTIQNRTAENDVSIITDEEGDGALRLFSATGEAFGIAQPTQSATLVTVTLRYRFEDEAKIELRLGNQILDMLWAPESGPGSPASGEWATYRNVFDLKELQLNPEPPYVFELLVSAPGDPAVLIDDLALVAGRVSISGDFDADGDVDLADYLVYLKCMRGVAVRVPSDCSPADFDGDGDVDLADLVAFQAALTGAR